MVNTNNLQTREIEQLQHEGNKALILNILFFVVLFVGVLLVPVLGLTFSAIAIVLAFVFSLLYIYLT
jgi:uncharacterized membrane protein